MYYVRNNVKGQKLNRSEPHMTESTMFNVENPTKVIVHGWLGTTQEKEGLCSYNRKCKFVSYNTHDISIFTTYIIITNVVFNIIITLIRNTHKDRYFEKSLSTLVTGILNIME